MRRRNNPMQASEPARPEIDWDGLISFIQSLKKRDEWELGQRATQLAKVEQGAHEQPEKRPEGTLLTVREVCQRLQVHRSTLHEWHSSGKFPAPIRLNPDNHRNARWRESDVLAWLEDQERRLGR